MASALQRRGWSVTLIDRNNDVAQAASGNPVGILMPRVAAAPSLESRFAMAAWRFVLRTLEDLADAGAALGWERCGVLQLATDQADVARLTAMAESGILPEKDAFYVDAAEAARVTGCAVPGGLFFKDGGMIQPRLFCAALAQGARHVMNTAITSLRHDSEGFVLGHSGGADLRADIVILANGLDAAALPDASWLPLSPRRGQLTFATPTAASSELRCVVSYGGYVTPVVRGHHTIGATFDWIDDPASPQHVVPTDHERNRADLDAHLPGFMAGSDPAGDTGRAAVRCVTTDHLPIVGPAPDRAAYLSDYAHLRHGQHWRRYPPATYCPGLYLLTGLGARGLVEAPLAAELLACHISGEPWLLERDLVTALHPARFLVRDLKRLRA
jgi:tRNA 5-methylaminomethyl-2-thiouridine biosynthesis bifunctional protein